MPNHEPFSLRGAIPFLPAFLVVAVAALAPAALAPEGLAAQEPVPSRMIADEMERSRTCVPVLARLEELNRELEPLARRVERIEALYEAAVLEDLTRVEPLDPALPEDRLVEAWFAADAELAARYAETEDESVLQDRRARKAELVTGLEEAFATVSEEADEILARDAELPRLVGECDGAILVRPAVLEVCPEGAESRVCLGARAPEPLGDFRYVEAAEDLWDVEQYRPWSTPVGIRPTPEGLVGGGMTGTVSRRGNVVLSMRLEPMLRLRADLPEDEAAEFDALLGSMGFEFDHPRFVMAPSLVIELNMARSLDEETLYLLHFGDLSAPAEQVFWTATANQARPIRDSFALSEGVLMRLMSGDEVSLTAVRVDDADERQQGYPLYRVGLTTVGQEHAVTTLVSYMVGGQLAQDLAQLIPASPDGGEPGGDEPGSGGSR